MKNESKKLFMVNLQKICKQRNYNSLSDMALELCIPVGTLKCWLTGNRIPKLKSLDKLANKLGCLSFNLICPNSDFTDMGIYDNDIHKIFSINMKIVFINNQAKTYSEKLKLLDYVISYDVLISYLRQNKYRLPTLQTLDKIANALNMHSYDLIREGILNEESYN